MRVATGWITDGGKFYLTEEAAKSAELREEITRGFAARHTIAMTSVNALLVDYILEKYELTRK